MANARDPKAKSTGADGRTPRSKFGAGPELARKSVSTSESTLTTARNATIQGNAVISADEVRQRAYELYEQRGRLEGFHEQDWHEAESQLRSARNGSQPEKLHHKKSA